MKKDYYLIDYAKLFFAFCIVAIHTNLLANFNQNVSFWVTQLVFRVGVPFFFISSGFFLGQKLNNVDYDYQESKKIIFSYCKRLGVLLVVFEPVSVLFSAYTKINLGMRSFSIVIELLQEILFYPKGALWFIQACMVGALLFLFFLKKKTKIMSIFFVSAVMYCSALFCNSYSFLIEKNIVLSHFVDLYMDVFLSTRNGFFCGLFYLMLGILCVKLLKRMTKRQSLFFVCCFFSLYATELFFLKANGGYPSRDDFSLFIFLPCFAFFLVLLLLQFNRYSEKGSVYVRNLSTGVYLLHSPINFFVSRIVLKILKVDNEWVFVVVSVCAVIICVWSYKSNNKLSKYLR